MPIRLRRSCGFRTLGGIYVMTELAQNGMPIEHFLIDPVRVVPDIRALGLTEIGVSILPAHDRPGVYDLYDYIGLEYENMWDYIVEGSRHGFSGKVSPKIDFSKLTRDSRRIPVFPRAVLNNAHEYTADRQGICPTGKKACANQGGAMCVGLPKEATTSGIPAGHPDHARAVIRRLPSSDSYNAWLSPKNVTPDWEAGIALWLPITGYDVIKDPEANKHQEALEILKLAGLGDLTHLEDA